VRGASGNEKDAVNDFAGVFKYIRDLWADDDIDVSGMVKHWGDALAAQGVRHHAFLFQSPRVQLD